MTDIQSIIEQMSLEEKAALCTGNSNWTTIAVTRLGVPEMVVSDGPHGVRRIKDVNAPVHQGLPATCFPTASCMASTWDVELLNEVGQALGEECIALKVDVLLGPGANMKRTPLCGRNFEYFSEDPFLAGKMAARFINGVQSKGVGTSLKHFAANNQEFQRFSINASIDERALREIYLPAFETAVKEAKPWTVMCAYNKLNGTYCSENHGLLVDILKDEWGFEGLVVSDWGAVHDRVASLKGGLDLEMPGPKERRTQSVVEAVRSGTLDQAMLDEAVAGCTEPHAILPALADTIARFEIPTRYFHDLILGAEMDLTIASYATFDRLSEYCYRVAGTVGLTCLHVFGFRDARSPDLAERLGLAFQMTNILRDVRSDFEMGRVYLPREDLDRFGCAAGDLRGPLTPQLRDLLEFEADRAWRLYEEGAPLVGQVDADSRATLWALVRTYSSRLARIAECGFDVFSSRI